MCHPAVLTFAIPWGAGLVIEGIREYNQTKRELDELANQKPPLSSPLASPAKAPQFGLNQAQQDARNILSKKMGTRRLQVPLGGAGTSKLTIAGNQEDEKLKKKRSGLNILT